MRKLRILLAEVIGLGVLTAWLMWKYPELVDDIIPWVALGFLWHCTWEFILDTRVTRRASASLHKAVRPMIAWPLVFAIGGGISMLYWWSINKSMLRLATVAAQRAAQKANSSQPHEVTEKTAADHKEPHSATNAAAAKPDHPKPKSKEPVRAEQPPTLSDLFKADFPNLVKHTEDYLGIRYNNGDVLSIKSQVYIDFPGKNEFVGFFVPQSPLNFPDRAYYACLDLADRVVETIDHMKKQIQMTMGDEGGTTSLQDLAFSGRVFLYHEQPLSNKQKAAIINAFDAHHYDVQFRGPEYLLDAVSSWRRHKQDAPK